MKFLDKKLNICNSVKMLFSYLFFSFDVGIFVLYVLCIFGCQNRMYLWCQALKKVENLALLKYYAKSFFEAN